MSPCWKLCTLKGHVPNTGTSKKIIYGRLSSWTVMGKRKWRGWEEGDGGRRGAFGGAPRGPGGSSLLIFLGQQKSGGGLSLCWQTHLAGNCSDQPDNQSWKCMDKQKFTAPIGKVNRSPIRPVYKQWNCQVRASLWSVVCVSIILPGLAAGFLLKLLNEDMDLTGSCHFW